MASLLAAAPAPAQSPTVRGYDESNGALGANTTDGVLGKGYDESGVLGTVAGSDRTNGAGGEAASGDLPFTGFEAGLVGLMGAALLGTGLVLRRTQRRPTA